MSFSQLSSVSDFSILNLRPYKRRKISDPVQNLFDETRKHSSELLEENGLPFKRRKIEVVPKASFSEKSESFSSSSEKSESSSSSSEKSESSSSSAAPPFFQGVRLDRFIPRAVNKELLQGNLELDTTYKKYLAANLLGSTDPQDEKVFHFSAAKEKKKNPYDSSIHNPSIDSIKYPTCSVKKVVSVGRLEDDFYCDAMAYNQKQDCLAFIVDLTVFIKKGDFVYQSFPNFRDVPSAVAFNPEGTALLVSLRSGYLGVFDLVFNQNDISQSLVWESDEFYSPWLPQRNHFVISQAYIFVGTEDGRICRISRGAPEEKKFYENIDGQQVGGLALSPDETLLLVGNEGGGISLFDVNNPRPLHYQKLTRGCVKALTFSPCGQFFLIGGGSLDPRLILFKVENQQMKKVLSYNVAFQTTSLFWHKNYVVSTHRDGVVRTFLVNPDSFALISRPKCEPISLGNRLTYAALRQGESSETLFIGSGSENKLFEVEIKAPYQNEEKKSELFSSRYDTIR